ncbi:MAG: hypothetical protein GXO59_03000 [Dictyoglomi bacterium]|jgi:tRNA A37 threonylcarbamoyladenosine modification protein TsaB|nr:hypothetical protein [Dictyoglomota bacterium]
MNRILIFTSVSPSLVAIWEDKTIYEISVSGGKGSKFLSRILSAYPLKYDEVWVGIGPGAFTGTRVGVAYALGLVAGLNLERVHVFDTFDFLYAPFYGKDLQIVIPARRGEVYSAIFRNSNKVEEGVYKIDEINPDVPVLSYTKYVSGSVDMIKPSMLHVDAMMKHNLYTSVAPEDVKVRYLKPLTEEYRVYGKD